MNLLTMARRLTNPATKEATAFYAAVTAGALDVFHRGANLWNVVLLASLAGVGVASVLGLVLNRKPEDPGA